jgi:hypothetical protein
VIIMGVLGDFISPSLAQRLLALQQSGAFKRASQQDFAPGQGDGIVRRAGVDEIPLDPMPVRANVEPPSEIPLRFMRADTGQQADAGNPNAPRVAGFSELMKQAPKRAIDPNAIADPPELPFQPIQYQPRAGSNEIPLNVMQSNVDVDPQRNFERATTPASGGFSEVMRRAGNLAPTDAIDLSGLNQEMANQQQQYQRYVQPGGAQQRAMQMLNEGPTQHHGSGGWKGFVEHVVDGAKAAGKAFLVTGNPIAAATAGIASGINPQYEHNLDYNLRLPHVLSQAEAEADLQNKGLQRAHTGNQIAMAPLQAANTLSEIANRTDEIGHRATTEALTRLQRFTSMAAPGTVVPDDIAAAAKIPRGSTVWHRTSNGEHYIKDPDGQVLQLKGGKSYPVADAATGQQTREYIPPPTPRYIPTDNGYVEVTPGRGGAAPRVQPVPAPGGGTLQPRTAPKAASRDEVSSAVYEQMRASGKIGPDNMMANPRAALNDSETENVEFVRALRGDGAAEARKQEILNSKRVPYWDHPDFHAEVTRQMAAAQKDARSKGKGGATPASAPAGMSAEQHEQLYQQNYNRLSPAQRQEFEQKFQQQFGRLPKRPQ